MTDMKKKADNVKEIFDALKKVYSTDYIALDFKTPMELLVATILSAQATDAGVNKVTPALFARCPEPKDYAAIDIKELEQMIFSTGFYHNKAKNIQGAAKVITERYGNVVPSTMEELLTLPGVARKTANIVLHHAFGINVGIAVDTHVKRIAQLLGLTASDNPVIIERDLMAKIPESDWGITNTLLVQHGRQVCIANRPKCSECAVKEYCPSKKA